MPPRDLALPAHPDVLVEAEETVWRGRAPLQLITFRHRRFDGALSPARTWEVWRRGPAAAVLPYDPASDRVVLIEQFRLPALAAGVPPVMVEVPAGLLDAGEDPAETVRREAVEEMGLPVDRLHRVGAFVLAPGGCDECITVFVGRVQAPEPGPDGLVGHAGLASEGEDIRVRVMPAAEAVEAALAGRYPNSVTTLALMWLASRRGWLREHWGTP